MGLGSVMQTALSGMTAATTSIDVVAHNLANSRTPGYKASHVRFASQPYQTYSFGSGPTANSGGTNPVQVGHGVQVACIAPDFSQGPIELNDLPALLALQGEGFFILEGYDGGYEYTRDGGFLLSSAGELLSAGGQRVLGYVGRPFQADADGPEGPSYDLLSPIQIVVGSHAPAADGSVASLTGYQITAGGQVMGLYDDGLPRTLGQLLVARFNNPSGLSPQADNIYQATNASGMPVVTPPGQQGAATVVPGATELSNVDIGQELIELTLAENQFQANLIVAHTAGDMLEELIYLHR